MCVCVLHLDGERGRVCLCVFANVSYELLTVPCATFITPHAESHVNAGGRPFACFVQCVCVCNLVTFYPHKVAPNSPFQTKA